MNTQFEYCVKMQYTNKFDKITVLNILAEVLHSIKGHSSCLINLNECFCLLSTELK